MQHVTPIQFIKTLFGEPIGPGQLVIWTRSSRGGSHYTYWPNNLDEAARQACRYRTSRDVYFGIALQDREKAIEIAQRRRSRANARHVRGSEDSATLLPALWADLDVAGPGHSRADLPPDRDAALGLLEALPRPPSIVVHTGGGFHLYWLLREPLVLDTPAARRMAKGLVRKLQAALRAAAAERGWGVDDTANLAQMLRLPGTLNHKSQPAVAVTVEHFPLASGAGEERCVPEDFDHLPEPDAGSGAEALMREPAARRDEGPAADFRPVFDGCSYLRYCYDQRTGLPEPEWQAALTVIARCRLGDTDGRRLGHRFSRDHPGYTVAATDAKIDHALAARGPRTCNRIAGLSARAAACCAGCGHQGQVKSPIVLGRRPPVPPIESYAVDASSARRAGVGAPPARRSSVGAPPAGDAPQILITTREHQVNDRALAALAAAEPNLFQRGGMLVQVVHPGARPLADSTVADTSGADISGADTSGVRAAAAGEPPRVKPLAEPRLRELLARHCAFHKLAGSGQARPAHPPRWTVRALLGRGAWPAVRTLEGVVEGPVLRADGSVLQRRGFDAASGLVYAPNAAFDRVPESPGKPAAEAALEALREVACDFPFRGEVHFAAWLAALLTPLARPAFDGPAPLNLIDADAAGTGKSLLADVCSTLLTGRPAARMSYSPDEEENRKQITSIALQATRLVLIDNVAGELGSATLDRALTAETWSDRLLGGNEQVSMALKATWYATGNNVVLRADTARRCLHIRLETRSARPESRTDFRHPRLLAWLRRERGRLLPAALTLLRAYAAAGSPSPDLPGWGSFEGWSDVVRSTVVWLGLPDPAAARPGPAGRVMAHPGHAASARRETTAAPAGAGHSPLRDLVRGLGELLEARGGAASSREILDQLASPHSAGTATFATLRSALAELFPNHSAGTLPTAAQLSVELAAACGRPAGGACIERGPRSCKGVRWRVRQIEQEASPWRHVHAPRARPEPGLTDPRTPEPAARAGAPRAAARPAGPRCAPSSSGGSSCPSPTRSPTRPGSPGSRCRSTSRSPCRRTPCAGESPATTPGSSAAARSTTSSASSAV